MDDEGTFNWHSLQNVCPTLITLFILASWKKMKATSYVIEQIKDFMSVLIGNKLSENLGIEKI